MIFGHFGSQETAETLKNHVGFWTVWPKVVKSDILDLLSDLAKTLRPGRASGGGPGGLRGPKSTVWPYLVVWLWEVPWDLVWDLKMVQN